MKPDIEIIVGIYLLLFAKENEELRTLYCLNVEKEFKSRKSRNSKINFRNRKMY